jgi:hypothetical protein
MNDNNEKPVEQVEKTSKGSRNLLILGTGAVLAALITSLVSLYVYHASGDIYLDCSLPEADCPSARANSEENNRDDVYSFPDSGNISEDDLDKYLEEIAKPADRIKKTVEVFDDDALSDESLGI